MRAALRGARAAIVFLTQVPVGGFPYSPKEWQWASGWFPLVGAVLGAICAALWTTVLPLGPWVAATTVLVASILLTGAFHEDGLADTADALGGARDRAQIFIILKDSRVGAYGALALVVSFVFRLALLARLGSVAPSAVPAALILAHGLARLGPVWLMASLPYVSGKGAKSGSLAGAGIGQVALATATAVAVAGGIVWAGVGWGAAEALGPAAISGALGALAVATALCGWRFRARAGGVTGDFLGAAEQLGEIAILFALAAAADYAA